MNKYLSIPVEEFSFNAVEEDTRLFRLELKFMHDGENLNKSFISLGSIKQATDKSLVNIPILADFNADGTDFTEHTDEEIGIGLIPELNNNLRFEKDDANDKTYAYVDGYIWRNYSKTAVDILEEAKDKSKACSIEIEILEGKKDRKRGLYIINSFQFLGITLLGDKFKPGMEGAKATLFSIDSKEKYVNQIKELNEELKICFSKSIQSTISPEDISDDIDKNNIFNEKEDDLMEFNKKDFAIKFGLTTNQMYDELYKATRNKESMATDWGYTMCRFSMRDYDETYVYCADYKEDKMLRVPYTMEGDNPSLSFDKAERVKSQFVLWDDGDGEDSENENDMDMMFIQKEKESLKELSDSATTKFNLELESSKTEFTNQLILKDTEIDRLKKFELDTIHTETQIKADKLYAENADFITEEEKTELNNVLFSIANFEDFENKVARIVAPKVKAQLYALKQNVNNDPNKIDITLMGLPNGDINNNNKTNKSSIELLEDYVKEV